MVDIELTSQEVLEEMQRQFPKETTIVVQQLQIKKLTALVPADDVDDDIDDA